MVKVHAWLALAVVSLGTVAAIAGCGSDEATGGNGTGGGLIAGGGLSSGGTSSGGSNAAVGHGGTTSVTGGGTAGTTGTTATGALGLPCTADLDCGNGLKCVLPNSGVFGGGGPANGLCTAVCMSDADCTTLDATAACIPFSSTATSGYCLQSCTLGSPTAATDKCQGRADELCADLSTTSTPDYFCVPWCQADSQCGTGMYCDPGSGLCSATKPTGDPVGTACDPNAKTTTCLGFCLTTSAQGVTPVTGACAEICSGLTECMFSGTKPGGICVGLNNDEGFLDIGFCEGSCNCTKDCAITGDLCQAFGTDAGSAQYKADLKTNGFCYPNVTGSTELTCSGGSGAGGAGAGPGGATSGGSSGSSAGGASAGVGGASAGTGG